MQPRDDTVDEQHRADGPQHPYPEQDRDAAGADPAVADEAGWADRPQDAGVYDAGVQNEGPGSEPGTDLGTGVDAGAGQVTRSEVDQPSSEPAHDVPPAGEPQDDAPDQLARGDLGYQPDVAEVPEARTSTEDSWTDNREGDLQATAAAERMDPVLVNQDWVQQDRVEQGAAEDELAASDRGEAEQFDGERAQLMNPVLADQDWVQPEPALDTEADRGDRGLDAAGGSDTVSGPDSLATVDAAGMAGPVDAGPVDAGPVDAGTAEPATESFDAAPSAAESTAGLAGAAAAAGAAGAGVAGAGSPGTGLPGSRDADLGAPLLAQEAAEELRQQWRNVQAGFVDDPRQAVRDADELVGQLVQTLTSALADRRRRVDQGDEGDGQAEGTGTEELRMALRNYRALFERLLGV